MGLTVPDVKHAARIHEDAMRAIERAAKRIGLRTIASLARA